MILKNCLKNNVVILDARSKLDVVNDTFLAKINRRQEDLLTNRYCSVDAVLVQGKILRP